MKLHSFFFCIILYLSISTSNAQCFVNESKASTNQFSTLNSSGDARIDNTFYKINMFLANTTGVSVKAGYYDDTETGPNAFAVPANSYNLDGETYFGLNLLNNYLSGGDNYILWVLSHEYAHIYQFKKGGMKWKKTKWNELQADFIAGTIAAKHVLENMPESSPSYEFVDDYVDKSFNFFRSLGDTNFGNKNHHGTPRERQKAFFQGMKCALFQGALKMQSDGYSIYRYLDLDEVWYSSINYINDEKND